jgi:hypothetical protein
MAGAGINAEETLAARVASGDNVARDLYRRIREPAVQAYTSRVCSLDAVSAETVAKAFDAVGDSPELATVSSNQELDTLLLRMTRREAAARTASPNVQEPVKGFASISRGLGKRFGRDAACEAMPKLLAARANGLLSETDLVRLDRHLAHCFGCRMLEARFARAEEAFAARVAENPLPGGDEPVTVPAQPVTQVAAPPVEGSEPPTSDAADDEPAPADAVAEEPEPTEEEDRPEEQRPARPVPPLTRGPLPPAPYVDPAGKARGRRLGPAVALAVLVFLVVAGGAYLLVSRGQSSNPPDEFLGGATTAAPTAPTGSAPTTRPETPVYDVTNLTVSVLDAAGDKKAVSEAASRLQAAGFQIGDTKGSTETPVECTTVVFEEKDPDARREGLAAKRKLLPLRSVLLQPLPAGKIKSLTQGANVAVLAGPDLIKNLPDDHCTGK